VVRQAAGPDGATLKPGEQVRAVTVSAGGTQPAADRADGNAHHAPQHRGGLTGYQAAPAVLGGDLCPRSPAHGDREPGACRADGDDRWSRLPFAATAPGLIPFDQVRDGVGKAAAVTTAFADLGQQVQELVKQAPLIDGAEQDQVPLTSEHPVTGN
jgi:hypothetical protein